MQQLSDLSSMLQPVGMSNLVEQHCLYPGQRRTQLVQAMLTRLLGGKPFNEVQVAGADQYDGLPEDERLARKCQAILQHMGIKATPEQLRGCSGQQDRDTAPLLQMAKLLVAMESRRAAASKTHSHQQQTDQDAPPQADPAASINKITQLLSAAVGQLSKLLSEAVQLFPSDMEDALKPYGDQGALAQLPQLYQQSVQRAQQLQQALQQSLASGAAGCEDAGGEQWQQLVQDVDTALSRHLQEVQAFDAVYQQELSVWAGSTGANNQQQRQQQQPWADLRSGSSSLGGPEATGLVARNLMAAYAELQSVMEAVGTIMMQHQALKDVPAAALQQQKDRHFQETYNLRLGASAVRPQ